MKANHSIRGFSLIEVMIVIVIIGVATATISVSMTPGTRDALRQDAQELAQRLNAAQYEVRIDGRLIAWQPLGNGYQFVRGVWTNVPGSVVPAISTSGELDRFVHHDILRPRQWRTQPLEVVTAKPVTLTSEWVSTPWQMELRSGDHVAVIVRNATGGFTVQ